MRSTRKSSPGFTLIELLTVIAIIGILAAIIIPVVGKVRSSARTATATSNLRQIGLAANLHATDRKVYPDGILAGWVSTWDGELQPYVSSSGGGWGNASRVFEDPARLIEPTAAAVTAKPLGVLTFSANPVLFPDRGGSDAPRLSPARVQRPAQTLLVATGAQMDDGQSSIFLRSTGDVYDSNSANGDRPIFATPAVDGGGWPGPEAPAYRHGGRMLAVMVDASVKGFLPGELRRRHFSPYY
jgi:prepilin-type N-terminal cleavage/methylation domain-containing protein